MIDIIYHNAMMNIRDLHYLIAVAEHKHFGHAARACFVSQPTLSMQLKKLEESLGVQLIERSNKHVMMTRAGDAVVKKAKNVLSEVDSIKALAKTFIDPYAGDVTIGAFPTLAPYLFPKIVHSIVQQYPKLKLFLVEEKSEVIQEKLLSGQLDMALLALPVNIDGLEVKELFQEDFYLAVNVKHPLARLTSVSDKDLQNETLLLLEDGHCLRDQALQVCHSLGAHEQRDFRATSMETLRQMVVANVGITLIPELAIKNDSSICYIPFENPKPRRKIGLLWRETAVNIECIMSLATLIQSKIQTKTDR